MPFQGFIDSRSVIVGFQPLILAADVDLTAKNVIQWMPMADTRDRLQVGLFQYLGESTTEILARLTLKGNFISARVRPQAYVPFLGA